MPCGPSAERSLQLPGSAQPPARSADESAEPDGVHANPRLGTSARSTCPAVLLVGTGGGVKGGGRARLRASPRRCAPRRAAPTARTGEKMELFVELRSAEPGFSGAGSSAVVLVLASGCKPSADHMSWLQRAENCTVP